MEYMLYASAKQPQIDRIGPDRKGRTAKPKKKGAGLTAQPTSTVQTNWKQDVPILVRAMVLAGKTLFLAGPPDLIDEAKTLATFETAETQELLAKQAAAIEGDTDAVLLAVSVGEGKRLSELKLDGQPVFDGMIAAGNRIYYATTDGRLVALQGTP